MSENKKKKQKSKRKEETKEKVESFRPAKSDKITMEAVRKLFPDFTKTEIISWAFVCLRREMLREESYLPKEIKLAIIRARITHLEREIKNKKFVLIHSRNRAVSWNRDYDRVESEKELLSARQVQLKHLKGSKVLNFLREKNDQILELHEQYKTILEGEEGDPQE